jgi:hypothetical protein
MSSHARTAGTIDGRARFIPPCVLCCVDISMRERDTVCNRGQYIEDEIGTESRHTELQQDGRNKQETNMRVLHGFAQALTVVSATAVVLMGSVSAVTPQVRWVIHHTVT